MTKHLRLIMLSLLAMICMGGYSQVKSVTCTLTDEEETIEPAGDLTFVPSRATDGKNGSGYFWNCAKGEVTVTVKLKDINAEISKIVVNAKCGKTTPVLDVKVGGTAFGKQVALTTSNADYTFEGKASGDIELLFSKKAAGNKPKSYYLKTITVYYTSTASSQTPTTVTFTGLTGEGVNLIDGKLDGNDFTGYTAKVVGDVAGEIKYTSDNEAVATVGQDGKLTIKDYGKATITATFTPADTKTYAESTASYTVTNTTLQYTSIADLKKVVTADEQSFELKLTNAIVTYVNRNSAFIQDESAGIFIYIKGGHNLKAGNTFTGTVNVKAMLYLGLAEITSWTSTVTPTNSEVPEPVVVTLAELAGDNYSKYESVRCKVVGVTVTKDMQNQNGEISQNGTVMPVRGGVQGLTMNEGAILDMIGYPSIYDGTKQFQVWKNSDMTEHQTVKEITLDENSDNNIVEEAKNVNVTLKRTLYGDGGWNTLCVPFTLTEAQTKAAFGNNVELRELESVAGNTLIFKTVNSVTANVPCLIKVTADGNEYKFEGVSTTAVKNNRDYTLSLVEGNILFLGIYSAMDVVEADLAGSSTNGYYAFLGANNTFFKAKAGTTMKAFRAFFSVPNDVNTKQLRAVIDGTTTGIEDLVIDGVKANGRVYNLNGQYVGNSLNGLQPGLYIQNGKKVVVK